MSQTIAQLEPKALWQNFSALNSVPRPSKKEEKVQAFMLKFLADLGLDHYQDKAGNIIAQKPATKGMENRRKVTLQAHLDMVCQKNNDTVFDFETQGINMLVEGNWVTADGTTLGADNGMGVAAIMAVLASQDIAHPPLEALFTADEEAGMTGAHNLEPNVLTGEILMNLDTEDDDELSIGCAGGIDNDIHWNYTESEVPSDYRAYQVIVKGLTGGHSGMDIIYCRANANKIMNRLLLHTGHQFGVSISYLNGGGLRNAIPRESEATVVFPQKEESILLEHWQKLADAIAEEFATTDPHLQIEFKALKSLPTKAMAAADFEKFTLAVQSVHNGIGRMSPDVPNLVETSNSVARIKVTDGAMEAKTLTRSDRESGKMDMAYRVAAPFKLIGAEVIHSGSYPGWKLDPNAPMLAMMKDLYQELFEEEPKVIACHAGLECGLLGQHYPNLEMISFGPTIRNPHSPDEKVSIPSVQKFWHYFLAALERIPEKK
jgi:dipeptidase D